jgi:hypothetical protein
MGWFKGYHFNEEGNITPHYFTLGTGFAFQFGAGQYWKTFKRKPPHWVLVSRSLDEQVVLMSKAVETLTALPEKKPICPAPMPLPPKATFREGDQDDVWESAIADGLQAIIDERRAQKNN